MLLRLAGGLIQLGLSVALSVLVVFVNYRAMIRANTDFDEELEIKKGNVAVGLLVAALLLASANIIHRALSPVLGALVFQVSAGTGGTPAWKLALYALGHLLMAFVLCIATISFSLRLFGRLTRRAMRMGRELEAANLAVGLVLAGVAFVVSLYIGEGVHSLSKAVIPEPGAARMQVMR